MIAAYSAVLKKINKNIHYEPYFQYDDANRAQYEIEFDLKTLVSQSLVVDELL